MNPWTKALQEALAEQYDKVPSDCVRLDALMKQWNCGRAKAMENVALLESKKKLERVRFKICVNGKGQSVAHYRLK